MRRLKSSSVPSARRECLIPSVPSATYLVPPRCDGVALAVVRAGAGASTATAASDEAGGAGGRPGGVVDAGMGAPVGAGQEGGVGVGIRAVRKYRGCRECGHHKVAGFQHHLGPRFGESSVLYAPENQRRQIRRARTKVPTRKRRFHPASAFFAGVHSMDKDMRKLCLEDIRKERCDAREESEAYETFIFLRVCRTGG